jgi:3-hydroxyisobutyrate dehydrogenase
MTSVGFVGAGIMGAPMAANAARAGLDVRLWNRTREKAEAVDGVTVADSVASAVEGADLVVTMLTDAAAVESVAGELLGAIGDDAVWLQMSTVGIKATERLAEQAGERGVPYVDAPVSGTKQPAEAGKLVVIASGPGDAIEKAKPFFDAVGEKTVVLDEVGDATRFKLVLNTWVVSVTEAVGATLAFAEMMDIDPQKFLDTIDGGPLNLPYAQLKGKMMIERDFPPSFPLSLARKDAGLVNEAAEAAGGRVPLTEHVEGQYRRAEELGHGDKDMAAVFYATREDDA